MGYGQGVNAGCAEGLVVHSSGDEVHPKPVPPGAVSVECLDGANKAAGPTKCSFREETDDETLEGMVIAQSASTEDAEVGDDALEGIERHRILSAGTYGQVWLASKKGTSEAYALKVQSKRQLVQSKEVENVMREKNIMASLDSPFIIKLMNTYQDEQNLYMVTKLYQGGDLSRVMQREDGGILPEKTAKFYAANILEGLSYMHRQQIIYRDLKPENVLLDSTGHTVIVDLGFAKYVPDKTYTFCGTLLYMAPEVLLQRGHDKRADHWSWGVLVYEMICGTTPFCVEDMDEMALFKRIAKQQYQFPDTDLISSNVKDLIQRLLVKKPAKRLGGNDIEEHGWFEEVDFEKLRRRELTPPWQPAIDDSFDVSNFNHWDQVEANSNDEWRLTEKHQKLFQHY